LSVPARRIKLPVKAPRGRPRGIRKRPAPCGTQAPTYGTGGPAVTRLHRILFYVAAVSLTSLAANPPAAADAPAAPALRPHGGARPAPPAGRGGYLFPGSFGPTRRPAAPPAAAARRQPDRGGAAQPGPAAAPGAAGQADAGRVPATRIRGGGPRRGTGRGEGR